MSYRFRVLGVFIVVCGVSVSYGAFQLWPAGNALTLVGVARMAAAGVAALIGVANVIAGLAVLLFRPTRQ